MKDEKQYEVVGDIRIKQPKQKKKKDKKKKSSTSDTPIIIKIFVWFMFIAMFASSFGVLIYYLISLMMAN